MTEEFTCDICGRILKNKAGLTAHKYHQHEKVINEQGESQLFLEQENKKKEIKTEMEESTNKFKDLREMFASEKASVFSSPKTDEEKKLDGINLTRHSIVQTMQVLIEVAALLHPEKLESALAEFEGEEDFKRMLILDWLDGVYRSYGQVHILEDMMVRALKRQLIDSGVLEASEELPEAPKTKLGPVLDELAQRIQRR